MSFVNNTKLMIRKYKKEIAERQEGQGLFFAGTMVDASAWIAMKMAFFERHPEYGLSNFNYHLYILNQFSRIPACQLSPENMDLYRHSSNVVKRQFQRLMERNLTALRTFCADVENGLYDHCDS